MSRSQVHLRSGFGAEPSGMNLHDPEDTPSRGISSRTLDLLGWARVWGHIMARLSSNLAEIFEGEHERQFIRYSNNYNSRQNRRVQTIHH